MKMLREKGFSKRQAANGVNAVFGCMTRALWRGENVELPIGWIKAVQTPAGRKQRLQKFRNVQTGKPFCKLIRPPERMIIFDPDRRRFSVAGMLFPRPRRFPNAESRGD